MTDDLFFDTDCLSAFLWIDQADLLERLYGGRIMIPAPVYRELSNPCIPHMKARTDALLDRRTAVLRQIETDTEEYHLYRTKYGLPFTLLSDTELTAIQAYDVWKEKNMYGKKSMGVVRTTYLIDEEGMIVQAVGKVKAAENPQQMLELL